MGNPASGQHLFGASRLEDLFPKIPDTPSAPVTPEPITPPAPPLTPPNPANGAGPGSLGNGGVVSNIIGGAGTNPPATGSVTGAPTSGNVPQGGAQTGTNQPIGPVSGIINSPSAPVSGELDESARRAALTGKDEITRPTETPTRSEGVVSGMILNNPAYSPKVAPTVPGAIGFSPTWGATTQPPPIDYGTQQVIPEAKPAAPVTPAAPVAAPVAKAAPKKKAAKEADPYERWKQLGRPGGSFANWKKGK